MRRTLKPILIKFLLAGVAFAQFRMDAPVQSLPTNLNGELDTQPSLSLFDPARFDISHGFTLSLIHI